MCVPGREIQMSEREIKLNELLDKLVRENEKKSSPNQR